MRDLPGAARALHYEYDVRIDTLDTTTAGAFADLQSVDIRSDAGNTRCWVSLSPSSKLSCTLGSKGVLLPFAQNLEPGAWHHVRLDLVLEATPTTVTLDVDGKVQIGPDAPLADAATGPGAVSIRTGVLAVGLPTAGFAVHIDDLWVALRR